MEEAHSPIFRARDAAVTGAAQVQREDRPEHQRTLSWGSSVSYDESCRVSIRSEGTFDQRQSSKMGSEHEERGSWSPTNERHSLSLPRISSASSAPYSARSSFSTMTARSRSFSIGSRSVASLSETDEPPTPTLPSKRRLSGADARPPIQQDTSRSRVSMDAASPAEDISAHTPRQGSWNLRSQSSRAMPSAGESSKRRGRVSFGPMETFDWTTAGQDNVFSSSSRLEATSPPPRPPRRQPITTLGYGLAQQYCRPQSQVGDPEQEDDWEDTPQRTPTVTADATLRSAPGVRGVGEGWAGGPQLTKTSWWKRRKKDTHEDDPLALWDTAVEGKADNTSPVKALWNRSVQAFGGSMPHLPLERRRTGKKEKGNRVSEGTIHEDEERESAGRQTLRQLFSRSTSSLAQAEKLPKVRDRIPISYSTSQLVSASMTSTGRVIPRSPIRQRATLVGSDTDLSVSPTMSPGELRRVAGPSGPRPPWRPTSYTSTTRPVNESDAEDDGLATPKMDRDESGGTASSDSSAARTDRSIHRTSTFGAGMISDDPPARIVKEEIAAGTSGIADRTFAAVSDDYWSGRRDGLRDSTVGFDTIAQWSTEPKERIALPSRRRSIFRRIQKVLGSPRSASMRRSDTPSPLKLFLRSTTPSVGRTTPVPGQSAVSPTPTPTPRVDTPAPPARAMTDSSYVIIHEAVKEALDTPPRAPQRTQSVRHRRRASWMNQGDGWMRRLSMLMEQDEEDRDRSNTASPTSYLSPRSLTPDSTNQAWRQAGLSRIPPQRKSSLRYWDVAEKVGDVYSPALTRLTTTDLDLRLVLPEVGLGLEDILVDSRRKSIIEMLDLDVVSNFPFPAPPSRAPTMPNLDRNPSTGSRHARNVSEPSNSLAPTTGRTTSHVRNASEPVDSMPLLEESRSIPHSTISASSSTFPETPHMTRADLYARRGERDHGLSHKSSSTSTTSWTDTSLHLPKDAAVEETSLYNALSRLSDVSELGAVVEAVKIPSMGGAARANMITTQN